MDRMKTLAKYVIWLVLFYIFSNLMIYLNIESTYQNIGRKDNLPQVTVYQAQATKVNGRIKGSVVNPEDNELTGKYLKFDFYSARDVLKGTKYIDVSELQKNGIQEIEMHFKLENVDYYTVSVVNEKTEKDMELLPQDLNKTQIVLATILI